MRKTSRDAEQGATADAPKLKAIVEVVALLMSRDEEYVCAFADELKRRHRPPKSVHLRLVGK